MGNRVGEAVAGRGQCAAGFRSCQSRSAATKEAVAETLVRASHPSTVGVPVIARLLRIRVRHRHMYRHSPRHRCLRRAVRRVFGAALGARLGAALAYVVSRGSRHEKRKEVAHRSAVLGSRSREMRRIAAAALPFLPAALWAGLLNKYGNESNIARGA